jgi:hypothetical protein
VKNVSFTQNSLKVFGHTQVQEVGRGDRSIQIQWKLRFPETANFVGPTTTICGNNAEVNAI